MVSVIILTAGKRKRLECTLASLVNQTFKNFEVIVSIDGDRRKITDIINKFKTYFPLKLVWIKNTDEFRMAWAFNKGTDVASGKYCLYLGEDTLLPPNGIEDMYNEITKPYGRKKVGDRFFIVTHPRMNIYLKNLTCSKITKDFNSIERKATLNYQPHNELDSGGLIDKKHVFKVGGEAELIPGISVIGEFKIRLRLEAGVIPKLINVPLYHIFHKKRKYQIPKHSCTYFLRYLALEKIPRSYIKKILKKHPTLIHKITKQTRNYPWGHPKIFEICKREANKIIHDYRITNRTYS